MSSASWVFLGLLFICPFYEASEIKEKSPLIKDRQRRSIMNLQAMVKAVTGREGIDFLNYGHWCGLGGSGSPVDPIDECCQNHDFCYDIAKRGSCADAGERGVYKLEYNWHVAGDETAVCDDENDRCKMVICYCDAIISNCLKSNLEFYNSNNKKWDIAQIIKDMDYVTSDRK